MERARSQPKERAMLVSLPHRGNLPRLQGYSGTSKLRFKRTFQIPPFKQPQIPALLQGMVVGRTFRTVAKSRPSIPTPLPDLPTPKPDIVLSHHAPTAGASQFVETYLSIQGLSTASLEDPRSRAGDP